MGIVDDRYCALPAKERQGRYLRELSRRLLKAQDSTAASIGGDAQFGPVELPVDLSFSAVWTQANWLGIFFYPYGAKDSRDGRD